MAHLVKCLLYKLEDMYLVPGTHRKYVFSWPCLSLSLVLGQVDFSEELLRRLIKSILVCNGNVLIFRFFDGSEVTRIWKDRSRRQSWTDEMKATARQKALERRNQNA